MPSKQIRLRLGSYPDGWYVELDQDECIVAVVMEKDGALSVHLNGLMPDGTFRTIEIPFDELVDAIQSAKHKILARN